MLARELRLKQDAIDAIVLAPASHPHAIHLAKEIADVPTTLEYLAHPVVGQALVVLVIALIARGYRVGRVTPLVVILCLLAQVGPIRCGLAGQEEQHRGERQAIVMWHLQSRVLGASF